MGDFFLAVWYGLYTTKRGGQVQTINVVERGAVLPDGVLVEVVFMVGEHGVYSGHVWNEKFEATVTDYEKKEIQKLVNRLLRVVDAVHSRMKSRMVGVGGPDPMRRD